MIAIFIIQSPHHHWSKTAGKAVDNSRSCGAHRGKTAKRMSLGAPFSMALFQKFPRLGWCARSRLFGRIATSELVNGSKTAANLSPVFQTGFSFNSSDKFQNCSFRPRYHKMFQFLVLLVGHVCNECSRCATAIGCFLFSAAFVACLSATCTTPTKSRQTRPSFPTWATSLSELAGHQGRWFHQPDARLRTYCGV